MTANLRTCRERLHLTTRRCAELLGTQHSNITRYEQGHLAPGRLMRTRIEAFCRLDAHSQFATQGRGSLPGYAVTLKRSLSAGDNDSVIRVLRQAARDFRSLTSELDREFFLQEPSTTGDARFDALLAGLAVQLCREAHLDSCPAWVFQESRYLPSLWWFGLAGQIPALRAQAFQNTPSSLKARGVVLDQRILDSV